MTDYHTHIHHHHPSLEARLEVMRRLECLEDKIDLVLNHQETIMSVLTDLQGSISAIATEVPTIAAGVTSIEAKLVALQNSTTTTLSPEDQAAVTQMQTDVVTIKGSLDAINTSLTPATPAA